MFSHEKKLNAKNKAVKVAKPKHRRIYLFLMEAKAKRSRIPNFLNEAKAKSKVQGQENDE